jgi:hypothetical protein
MLRFLCFAVITLLQVLAGPGDTTDLTPTDLIVKDYLYDVPETDRREPAIVAYTPISDRGRNGTI